MQLAELLTTLELNDIVPDRIKITGVSNSSKAVKPGHLFIAIPGHVVDGHEYIEHAISLGAVAVIGEHSLTDLPVPYIQVINSRKTLALAAKAFYYPHNTKTIIGVTGTNGKTTTAFMLQHIFKQNGVSCSLFSSVYNEVNGEKKASKNTTSDALELYKQLSKSQDQLVILEVTSHALIQHRVEGLVFDCCIFTNLSQDHLDYHVTMENYFEAKRLLFTMLKADGIAVINTENQWGQALAEELTNKGIRVRKLFGVESDVSMRIEDVTYVEELMHLTIQENTLATYTLHLPVFGEHNAHNATTALATAKTINISLIDAISALETFEGAPGRFERYTHPSGGTVIIDYAHTADAFLHLLNTARTLGANRIIHVFGFRGNRDKTKRQAMIRVSLDISDYVILTLDDINNETSETMNKQLEAFDLQNKGMVIADRMSAIKKAWSMIHEGDWLFITGKGQETYQRTKDLDYRTDCEVVTSLLK